MFVLARAALGTETCNSQPSPVHRWLGIVTYATWPLPRIVPEADHVPIEYSNEYKYSNKHDCAKRTILFCNPVAPRHTETSIGDRQILLRF
jgi:hypothetical protein